MLYTNNLDSSACDSPALESYNVLADIEESNKEVDCGISLADLNHFANKVLSDNFNGELTDDCFLSLIEPKNTCEKRKRENNEKI